MNIAKVPLEANEVRSTRRVSGLEMKLLFIQIGCFV